MFHEVSSYAMLEIDEHYLYSKGRRNTDLNSRYSYVNGQGWAVDGGLSAGHPVVPGKLA